VRLVRESRASAHARGMAVEPEGGVSDLRYTLQWRRHLRWRTAKSYDAEREDFDVIEHVMGQLARQHPRFEFRILLMPANVLAAQVRRAA